MFCFANSFEEGGNSRRGSRPSRFASGQADHWTGVMSANQRAVQDGLSSGLTRGGPSMQTRILG